FHSHRDAGRRRPPLPLVDDDPLQLPGFGAEEVRRVAVVGDDHELRGRRERGERALPTEQDQRGETGQCSERPYPMTPRPYLKKLPTASVIAAECLGS